MELAFTVRCVILLSMVSVWHALRCSKRSLYGLDEGGVVAITGAGHERLKRRIRHARV